MIYLKAILQIVDKSWSTTRLGAGPFLFSIYINDLPTSTTLFTMIMYADDTTLYCDIKDVPNHENVLNVELCKITNWLAANKLSLNVGETKFMDFH